MGRAEDLFARLEGDGERYLDELIATRKHEEAFLDFKRSADHGSGHVLHDADRAVLGKAISGFANSDGGVLVWGVRTAGSGTGDHAAEKLPLTDCRRFSSLLDGAISGCTVPPASGVRSIPIPMATGDGGFVATLVPQSAYAPHQAVDRHYYIRTGQSFQPVTHGILSGLFGRHPHAVVHPRFLLLPLRVIEMQRGDRGKVMLAQIVARVMLQNESAVMASDMYLSVLFPSIGGPASAISIDVAPESKAWHVNSVTDRDCGFVSLPHNRLPPGGRATAARIALRLEPPFTEPLEFHLTAGCSGSPPFEQRTLVQPYDLGVLFQKAVDRWINPAARSSRDWHLDAAQVLGLSAHWEKGQEDTRIDLSNLRRN